MMKLDVCWTLKKRARIAGVYLIQIMN